jgi:hypothetical protein
MLVENHEGQQDGERDDQLQPRGRAVADPLNELAKQIQDAILPPFQKELGSSMSYVGMLQSP